MTYTKINFKLDFTSNDKEPSFYEQALLAIREKPSLFKDFNIEFDTDYQLIEDDSSNNETMTFPRIDTVHEDSLKTKLRRQPENANILNKTSSATVVFVKSETVKDSSILRESSVSSPAPNQLILPKIDNRYLPNNNQK